MDQKPGWANQEVEEQVEREISDVLRGGLVIASVIVLAGAAVYLFRHGGERPDFRVFRSQPAELRSIEGILRASWRGSGSGLIQLGLLVLLATPVARVALSVVAFARQRDAFYVLVTLIVLAVLLYSIVGGRS